MIRIGRPVMQRRIILSSSPSLKLMAIRRLSSPSTAAATTTAPPPKLPGPLVSADWVLANLQGLKLVDGSWYMPADKIDARKKYEGARLPHARYFDPDEIADKTTDLPHMMPTPQMFADIVGGRMGISERDTIVVYDQRGLFSAPRVWYTFKIFGAANVAILDGGLPLWMRRALPIESGPTPTFPPAAFNTSLFRSSNIKTSDDIFRNFRTSSALTIDARSAERFAGAVPEPRPHLRRGHIPLSVNVPFTEVLTKHPNTDIPQLKSVAELRAIFESRGVSFEGRSARRPLINSCGSGMTACVNIFALYNCGLSLDQLLLYDGSWTEYGANRNLPVETFTSNLPPSFNGKIPPLEPEIPPP